MRSEPQIRREWRGEIQALPRWSDPGRARRALEATCHALLDQLEPRLSLELGAQLPEGLESAYATRWRPDSLPRRVRNADGFLALVAREYREPDVERAARAVLWMLRGRITGALVRAIGTSLGGRLRDLWPEPLPALHAGAKGCGGSEVRHAAVSRSTA